MLRSCELLLFLVASPRLWCPGTMDRLLLVFLTICVILKSSTQEVSTKLDFGEDVEDAPSTGEKKAEDDDVEVKHTIVLTTNLKNNNRRAITSKSNGESGALTYHIGTEKPKKQDSGEVPIVPGYKAVGTTQIYTPDTRKKTGIYPDSFFISRNIRDDYDTFPNIAITPHQWKPSNFFNNINWKLSDGNNPNDFRTKIQGGLHRKMSNAGARDFYCKKCRELSSPSTPNGCVEKRQHSWLEATTSKIKLDGKLAKLN